MEAVMNEMEQTVMTAAESTEVSPCDSRMQVSNDQETRLKAVLDYQADVLNKENRLEAALGTVNAGLMGVTIQMDEFIEGALAASPKTVERVQKLLPSIQTYLQATRQIDRLAQVELRVAAARKGKSAGKDDKPNKPR